MLCPHCGDGNDDAARACASCGAALCLVCASCGASAPPDHHFCGRCGMPLRGKHPDPGLLGRSVKPLAREVLEARVSAEGERKQVTALFADIRGSTDHIQRLDPEAALRFLDAGIEAMCAAVRRYEGTVCRVDGDGVFALFGAPRAQEDHAVRACFAALEMHQRARDAAERALVFRVGLNSGEVVVSFAENDLSLDYRATGVTVHVAKRLEALCRPGVVWISGTTYRLARRYVQAHALGQVAVRGLDQPLECFELTGRHPLGTLWEKRLPEQPTAFVGRRREFDLGAALAAKVAAGRGQVLALVGDPGEGKSRLAFELVRSPAFARWDLLHTGAPPFGKSTTCLPLGDLLRRRCAVDERDAPAAALGKVRAALGALGMATEQALPAIATLMRLPVEDPEWPRIDAGERRARIISEFSEWLARLAQARPLALLFDDLQWIDGETLAVLERVVEGIARERIMLVLTFRPEFAHRIGDLAHVHEVRVGPLDRASCDQLVERLSGAHPSVLALRERLWRWTAGTPLYVEQMIQALAEEGVLLGEPGAYRMAARPEHLAAPAGLQAVIASRIDRLSPAHKDLLQIASVLGERIQAPLLAELAGSEEVALEPHLDELVRLGFLRRGPEPGPGVASFRHALIRDVTYRGILEDERRALHRQTVRAIERLRADRLAEQVELLAHHAWSGGLWDEAAGYHARAADAAAERSAYHEAVEFFSRALLSLERESATAERSAQRIDLELRRRRALGAMGESRQAFDGLEQVEALARELDDDARMTEIHTFKAVELSHQGVLAPAIEAGREACRTALRTGERGLRTNALVTLGLAYYHQGAFRAAVETLDEAMLHLREGGRHQRFGAASTISVRCLGITTGARAYLGDFDGAFESGRTALRLAEEVERPIDFGTAAYFLGVAYLHRGRIAEAAAMLERGHRASREGNVRYILPFLGSALGLAHTLRGEIARGLPMIDEAVEQCQRMNLFYGGALSLVRLARAFLAGADLGESALWASRTLELAEYHDYQGIAVWARAVAGEAAAGGGDARTARDWLHRACAQASALGMVPDEVRLQERLGRLERDQGREETARAHFERAAQGYGRLGMRRAARAAAARLGGQ